MHPDSGIPSLFVKYQSVPAPTMNRLRRIPDPASIVEFTFKQNSNGRLVQQQTPMVRPGRSGLTSPRKRQKVGGDHEHPIQTADDTFIYLDHDLPQYSGSARIPFPLITLYSTEVSTFRRRKTTFANGSLAVTNKSRRYWISKPFQKTQLASIAVKMWLPIAAPIVMGRQLHAATVVMKPISDTLSIESNSGQDSTLLHPGSGRLVYALILGTEVILALACHLMSS